MNRGRLIGFAATMLIAMSAGPAFAQATVKVGVLLNLTGQLQTIGVQALAGMRLAAIYAARIAFVEKVA
ncbi:MAG: hypothetical protein WB820_21975 [Rhodoplanes sp.]|jgi:ABC-type branched-subunit amino acid transport system substrate-binding protein